MIPLIAKALEIPDPRIYQPTTQDTALVAPKEAIADPPEAPKQSPVGSSNVLERIAACESKNDPNAKNPHSSASGRFQFLKSSWEAYGRQLWGSTEGKDVLSYKDNTELAEYVYSIEGTAPWESSRYCWE